MGRRWRQYEGKEKKGTFKRAYYSGACSAIEMKLIQQKKQMESDNSHITTMVVSNEQAITDKVNDLFGDNIKTKQKKATKGMDGFIIGAQDGRNLEINKGLENQASGSPQIK
jgi:hypothetical protein